MGALLFLAGAMFVLLLGPLVGAALLIPRRTRHAAYFVLLMPAAAAGGGIFGFWVWLRLLNGRVTPPAAIERSFYLGCLPFYTLGAVLAVVALLHSRRARSGSAARLYVPALAAAFVALGYLGLAVIVREWIELHRISARMGRGAVGWDPVSYINHASSGQILASMLLAFAVVLIWKARHPSPAAQ